MKKLISAITALAVVISLSGAAFAASDSVSGDTPPSEATPQEIKLSERVSAQIEKEMTILVNPVYKARVETIVNRLAPQMERRLNYDVGIIDHKMVNAFALAGGKMYVTTGMLEFVKTDIELAGVIAHEMAHADKKHVIIQTARNNRMTLLAIAAAIASKGEGAALMAASVLQVAVMGAYSIDIEKEADSLGIDALTHAGYNPVGMLTIQERLKEERMKHPEINPGIYQTHPEVDERIAAAKKYLDNHDIRIERKLALGNLRTSVEEIASGDFKLAVAIDGEPVWRGADDEATLELFGRVAYDLRQYREMETVPFDVRIEGDKSNPNSAFYVKAKKIAANKELPPNTEPLSVLREGVMKALSEAQKNHPMADYYE
jgi:Zn-dependent protease with chaperone function